MVKMSKQLKSIPVPRCQFDSTQLCLIFVKLCVKSQYFVDTIIKVQMRKNSYVRMVITLHQIKEYPNIKYFLMYPITLHGN